MAGRTAAARPRPGSPLPGHGTFHIPSKDGTPLRCVPNDPMPLWHRGGSRLRFLHASWLVKIPARLQSRFELAHAQLDACFNRAHWFFETLGNFRMRQAFVVCEFKRLTLSR